MVGVLELRGEGVSIDIRGYRVSINTIFVIGVYKFGIRRRNSF